jgi:predicted CoA-binding protein
MNEAQTAPEEYVPSDDTLREIFGDAKTIAVVGLSAKPHRDSYAVAAYLQRAGYRIVPVNPKESDVLGERAYRTLADIPDDVEVDVVDVFRRAEETPPVATGAVERGARVLWLQDGIVNDESRTIGQEGGLKVVMGTCMKREHQRLMAEGTG